MTSATASDEEELTVAGPTAAACRAKSEEDYGKANLVQQGDRLTVSVCIVVMRKPLPRLICGGLKDWLAGEGREGDKISDIHLSSSRRSRGKS